MSVPGSIVPLVRRHTGWVIGLMALALVIVAVIHVGDVNAFASLLTTVRPGWLLVAMGLQATTYLSVVSGWRMVLAVGGTPRRLSRLYPIAVGKLFADQVIPLAGMGGMMLVVERLAALGVPRGTAMAVLLISTTGFYASYAACAAATLAILWAKGLASWWIVGLVSAFLAVALGIPTLIVWIRHRGKSASSVRLARFGLVRQLIRIVGEAPRALLVDRHLLIRVAGVNGLVFLADAGTLLICFRALGQDVSYSVAFVAVMAASMVATLGPIPLGLGTFEAGATGMLALMGVGLESALAATLLLRVFTLWIPLVPGFLLMGAALWSEAATD